jgi:hypothetical protein
MMILALVSREKLAYYPDIECQGTGRTEESRVLRPARLAQRHLLASLLAASVHLALPSVVLAKTGLGVAGVVEVDL